MTAAPLQPESATPRRGWVLFDGECRFCRGQVNRYGAMLRRHGWELAALQEEWVGRRLGLNNEELMREMRVLTSSGESLGGINALLRVGDSIPLVKPLSLLGRLPGLHALLDWGY